MLKMVKNVTELMTVSPKRVFLTYNLAEKKKSRIKNICLSKTHVQIQLPIKLLKVKMCIIDQNQTQLSK